MYVYEADVIDLENVKEQCERNGMFLRVVAKVGVNGWPIVEIGHRDRLQLLDFCGDLFGDFETVEEMIEFI